MFGIVEVEVRGRREDGREMARRDMASRPVERIRGVRGVEVRVSHGWRCMLSHMRVLVLVLEVVVHRAADAAATLQRRHETIRLVVELTAADA